MLSPGFMPIKSRKISSRISLLLADSCSIHLVFIVSLFLSWAMPGVVQGLEGLRFLGKDFALLEPVAEYFQCQRFDGSIDSVVFVGQTGICFLEQMVQPWQDDQIGL